MLTDVRVTVTCMRCGIGHTAYERARDQLCPDCRETDGHAWMNKARNEVERLARAEQPRTCRKGLHLLTDDNVYVRPDGRGRVCLACKRRAT